MDFETYLRYVRRQSSPAEARAAREWLAQPAHALLAQQWMEQYAQLVEQEEGEASQMPGFEQVQAELLAKLGLDAPATVALPEARSAWRWWSAAAAVAAGLTVGGSWLWQQQHAQPQQRTISTAIGQQRTVQLPDGSTVVLNSRSSLRYATDLAAAGVREVWLDGEGYFSVKHLPTHRRFVVRTTAGFNVEVLGTKFTVYRRHQQARVALLSGKVRVDFTDPQRSAEVVLKPGEVLETQDAHPRQVVHKATPVAPYAAWKDHKLVFDETPLAEVATRLSDTYGVTVVVADSALRQRQVTGTFPIGDLDALLQILEKSFQLTVRRQQQQIILSDHLSHQAL